MKRIGLLLTVVIVAALFVSGCAAPVTPVPTVAPEPTMAPEPTQPPAKEEVVELNFIHQYTEGAGAQPVVARLSEEYMEAHPNIKIKFEWAGWEMFDQKLTARIEAGESPEGVWVSAPTSAIYAREGLTTPLDEYLKGQNYEGDGVWMDSFSETLMGLSYIEDGAEGAGYYAVPTGLYTSGLWYNVAIFEELGITVPETWSELMAICDKVEAEGLACFEHDGGYTPYNVRPFIYLASRIVGVDTLYNTAQGQEGTSWVDNPDWVLVAEETQRFFDHMQDGFLGSAWPGAQIEFSQGLGAMMIVPDWLPSELKAEAPEGFRMEIFRFPAYEGGKGDQTVSEIKFNGWSLLKTGKHPQETADFYKFLSSRYGTGEQASEFLIAPPTIGAPAPDELAGSQWIVANSELMPMQGGLEGDAPDWMANVLEPLLGELALGMTPQEFVAELQKRSDEFYS